MTEFIFLNSLGDLTGSTLVFCDGSPRSFLNINGGTHAQRVGAPVYLELERLLLDKAEVLGFRTIVSVDLQRRSISISPAFYVKHGR